MLELLDGGDDVAFGEVVVVCVRDEVFDGYSFDVVPGGVSGVVVGDVSFGGDDLVSRVEDGADFCHGGLYETEAGAWGGDAGVEDVGVEFFEGEARGVLYDGLVEECLDAVVWADAGDVAVREWRIS